MVNELYYFFHLLFLWLIGWDYLVFGHRILLLWFVIAGPYLPENGPSFLVMCIRRLRWCLDFVFPSSITLFPSPTTQNMWVPQKKSWFRFIFCFCFHHSIILQFCRQTRREGKRAICNIEEYDTCPPFMYNNYVWDLMQ